MYLFGSSSFPLLVPVLSFSFFLFLSLSFSFFLFLSLSFFFSLFLLPLSSFLALFFLPPSLVLVVFYLIFIFLDDLMEIAEADDTKTATDMATPGYVDTSSFKVCCGCGVGVLCFVVLGVY